MTIKKSKKQRVSIVFFIIGGILLLYTLIMGSLFYYSIINSGKDLLGFIDDPINPPANWHWENYETILVMMKSTRGAGLKPAYIEDMFLYSLAYSIGMSLSSCLAIVLVAYATAMFPNKVSRIIDAVVIFTIVFPIIGNLPSKMQVAQDLKLYNNMFGNYFMAFSFPGLYYLVMNEMIKAIPKDYREAAEIDGASNFVVMVKIILPMCMKTIGAIFLIYFIQYWNDYQTPKLFLPKYPTIALGLLNFTNNTSGAVASEPLKICAAFIVLIPILILFVAFQKPLMGNLSEGGVKE